MTSEQRICTDGAAAVRHTYRDTAVGCRRCREPQSNGHESQVTTYNLNKTDSRAPRRSRDLTRWPYIALVALAVSTVTAVPVIHHTSRFCLLVDRKLCIQTLYLRSPFCPWAITHASTTLKANPLPLHRTHPPEHKTPKHPLKTINDTQGAYRLCLCALLSLPPLVCSSDNPMQTTMGGWLW